jgi:hypothetical protein
MNERKMRELTWDFSAVADEVVDANARDPREYPFGFFSRDDWPAGVGMFHWAATPPDALLGYAAMVIEHLYAGEDDDKEELRRFFSRALTEKQTLADLHEELNRRTARVSALGWYGTFQDICTSQDDFALDVRERFLEHLEEDEEEGEPTGVIPEDRMDEFVEFIQGSATDLVLVRFLSTR